MNGEECGDALIPIHALMDELDAPAVVRFPALGDTVLLTPLLDALRARYGTPVHLVASGPWVPVLLGQHPSVASLHMVRSRRAPYWSMPSQWRAAAWLRRHRGPVYLCEADRYAARLVERAVPPERLVRAWDHWPGDEVHWVDWWLQVARLDPPELPGPVSRAIPLAAAVPSLPLPPAWAHDASLWLRARGLSSPPLVLVQPGHKKTHKRGRVATSDHNKHWPSERWAAVCEGILQALPGGRVLLCGSPREHGLLTEIVQEVPATLRARVVDGSRDLPLQRLLGVAALAHSMVSVDTGPAHVAAAMDCPSVVLFGQFGWRRWKPRAPSAEVIALGPEAPTPGRAVIDISVDEVLGAWHQLVPRSQVVLKRA